MKRKELYQIVETVIQKVLTEGAWGHYPLDNDIASDWKWVFGDMILKELKDKMKKGEKQPKKYGVGDYLYYGLGMWEFFKDRLETNYSVFTDDDITEMNDICIDACNTLLSNDYGKDYNEPDKVRDYIKYIKGKLIEEVKYKDKSKYYNSITKK